MTVEELQPGIVLDWQSTRFPDSHSRWIVLEELEHDPRKNEKRARLYCIYSSRPKVGKINNEVTYTFTNSTIRNFTVNSQV